jgi:hypothetical protein
MYNTFRNIFLVEMPQKLPGGNDFDAQVEMLRENLKYNPSVIQVVTNVFKNINGDQVTYWVGDEDASKVQIIVDTNIIGTFCKIVLTSKNPILSGNSPYASDLYLIIKEDVKPMHMVFTSDELLSDDGIRLWKGLVNRGNKVSVYDTSKQEYILSTIEDESQLDKFIGDHNSKKYIFVLSEDIPHQRGIITTFSIMELKRKSSWPLPLFENLK